MLPSPTIARSVSGRKLMAVINTSAGSCALLAGIEAHRRRRTKQIADAMHMNQKMDLRNISNAGLFVY